LKPVPKILEPEPVPKIFKKVNITVEPGTRFQNWSWPVPGPVPKILEPPTDSGTGFKKFGPGGTEIRTGSDKSEPDTRFAQLQIASTANNY